MTPSTYVPRIGAILIAATCLIVAPPASAAPTGGLDLLLGSSSERSALIEPVQYRGQNRGRYEGRRSNRYSGNRYRRDGGRNLALGIGGLIIGGIVLNEVARTQHRREYSSDWARCSATYRSFEPDTGMYTGYDGIRRACPYLR